MKEIVSLIFLALCISTKAQKTCIVEYRVFQNATESSGLLTMAPRTKTVYYEQLTSPEDLKNREKKIGSENSSSAIDISSPLEYKKKRYQVFDRSKELLSNILYISDTKVLCDEKIPKFQWIISEERKKISNYYCVKATTNFRGRKYIVWFTSEIPCQFGPWKFNGLPGLILEAQDESSHYLWSVVNIKFGEHGDDFKVSNSFPKYTLQEFEIRDFEYYRKVQVERAKQLIAKFAKQKGVDPNSIQFKSVANKKEDLRTRELKFEWD